MHIEVSILYSTLVNLFLVTAKFANIFVSNLFFPKVCPELILAPIWIIFVILPEFSYFSTLGIFVSSPNIAVFNHQIRLLLHVGLDYGVFNFPPFLSVQFSVNTLLGGNIDTRPVASRGQN